MADTTSIAPNRAYASDRRGDVVEY